MKYSECKTEQAFKMEWIRRNRKNFTEIFCIETEETVKGFPDVLTLSENSVAQFAEFKKARNGFIHFQSTQPAFYKAHSNMLISVISLVENKGKYYVVALPIQIVMSRLKGAMNLDLRPWCIDKTEVENDRSRK